MPSPTFTGLHMHTHQLFSRGLLLASLGFASLTVQAQTSYLLTTLKPAASSYPMPRMQQFVIENTERVVSHGDFDLGYRLPLCIPSLGCFAGTRTYAAYPAYWPASTATSVAPVK